MGGFGNGRYPLSMMVHLGGLHYLPPGTAARWRWLVQQAFEKYGVILIITAGWNGYRPFDIQVQYKKDLGVWAAAPGYSSHGLIYLGKQVAAVDVHNWGVLGWARFKALCRLAGFTVDFVSPQELWHIGDFNDIWTVPAFTRQATPVWKPAPPTPFYARPHGRRKKARTMIALRILDGLGLLGPKGKQRTYVVGGGIFVDTTDHAAKTANAVSVIVQGYDANGKVNDTPNLTYAELYQWAKGSNALSPAELAPYAKAAGR